MAAADDRLMVTNLMLYFSDRYLGCLYFPTRIRVDAFIDFFCGCVRLGWADMQLVLFRLAQ